MCMSQAKQSVGRRRPQQARWELELIVVSSQSVGIDDFSDDSLIAA